MAVLTGLFWALWVYLALPLISVLLWFFGARRFVQNVGRESMEQLRAASIAYSSVLLVMVALLAAWILWNVVRYGGDNDRRTEKQPETPDDDLYRAFRIGPALVGRLRGAHRARLDLDAAGDVMILAASSMYGSRRSEAAALAATAGMAARPALPALAPMARIAGS